MNRLEREKFTLKKMVGIFCHAHHETKPNDLCAECSDLVSYSFDRIEKCPFGKNKPDCQSCLIHCYHKDKTEKIKRVMRFAGPRMAYKFPILAILHFYDKLTYRLGQRIKSK